MTAVDLSAECTYGDGAQTRVGPPERGDCRHVWRCYVPDMVSTRLDALIRHPIERTYLTRDDGYWADLVLAEFGFLEERGGTLDAVAFHQKGDYVSYRGPWGRVWIEFAPDNHPRGRWLYGGASLHGTTARYEGDLDGLAIERQPAVRLPDSAALDRPTIALNVRFWADLLRSATDLF